MINTVVFELFVVKQFLQDLIFINEQIDKNSGVEGQSINGIKMYYRYFLNQLFLMQKKMTQKMQIFGFIDKYHS